MDGLLHAHSYLRFLVLAAGFAGLVNAIIGQTKNQPPNKVARILGSSYSGLVDLQATLGLAMLGLGHGLAGMHGHLVMMLVAAVANHVLFVKARKQATPTWGFHLAAYAVSLGMMISGILALHRMPWVITVVSGGIDHPVG